MLVNQYTAQPLSEYAQNLPMGCPKDNEFDPQDWTSKILYIKVRLIGPQTI